MVLRPCKISSVHGWRMLRTVNMAEVKHYDVPETSKNRYSELTSFHASTYTLIVTLAIITQISAPVGAAAALADR